MNPDQVEPRISSLEEALEFRRSAFARIANRHHLDIA